MDVTLANRSANLSPTASGSSPSSVSTGGRNPRWPWAAAALSGILLLLTVAPFEQGWLAWFALTPLVAAGWSRRALPAPTAPWWRRLFARWRTFLLGYLAGLIYFAGAFHWLGALGVLFENHVLFGLPLLLAAYMGLYFGFWSWFISDVIRPVTYRFESSLGNLAIGAAAAAAWMAHEWVRGWLFSGFGWNGLSSALHHPYDLAFIQMAEFTGAYGLSGLLAFTNVMAVVIIRRIVSDFGPTFLKRVRWEFSATMLLISLVFSFGVRTLLHPVKGDSISLTYTALQPNVPEQWKFGHSDDRIRNVISDLNEKAANLPTDLIIWPEAAIPGGAFSDETNREFILREVARGDYSLLTGSLDYDVDGHSPEDQVSVYNAALLFSPHGESVQRYRKIHLVPFGEYVPNRPFMPKLVEDLVPGDLAFGREFNVLTLPKPKLQLGVVICFEDTLGDLCRHFSLNGAQILINVTNDAWFLKTAGAEQHLDNAMLRAVENRRPLIRAANTGVTCSIDPYGRIDRDTEPFQQGIFHGKIDVPLAPPITFYARYGDWCAELGAIVTVGCLCLAGLRNRRLSVH